MDADKFLVIGDTTYEVEKKHTTNEYAPPKRRSRRGSGSHAKRLRDLHGRNRVLEERRKREEREERRRLKRESTPPPPEEVMWREFTQEVRDGSSTDKWEDKGFQPTPRHLIGVETHPVAEFAKSRDYPHQPLENPTHLWCDVTHATDADVLRGNRKG